MTTTPTTRTDAHELKIWPAHFDAVESGRKRFELRLNDRNFQVGDSILLREWNPDPAAAEGYTGRKAKCWITHLLTSDDHGAIAPGYVIFSIQLENARIALTPRQAKHIDSTIVDLVELCESKQAKIDALMSEYCPDEMTPEQIAEWEKHQRPVSAEDLTTL